MNKTICAEILFKKTYPEPPKIKIVEPKIAAVERVTCDSFTCRMTINSNKTWKIDIKYQANFDQGDFIVYVQFCPACNKLLGHLTVFTPACMAGGNNLSQGPQLVFCPDCGCVFMIKKNLEEFKKSQESGLILPG